jgi:hypothetical protein
MERELDLATSTRCLAQYDAYTVCLAAGAPFCTPADSDAACGVEQGRFQACRMAL